MRAGLLLFLLFLAGCSDFPDLEGTVHRDVTDAPYLDFLTVDQLAAIDAPTQLDPVSQDQLAARLAALRARASILRGPIFSTTDRARLSGLPG